MRRPFESGTFSTIFSFSSCENREGGGDMPAVRMVPRVVCGGVQAGADQGRPNEAHERAGFSRNVGAAVAAAGGRRRTTRQDRPPGGMRGVPTSPTVVPARTLIAGHGALPAGAVGGRWRAAHLLEDVAGDGARARLEALRNGAAHAATAKDALEHANADAISQVHAARDGSGTDVVPIASAESRCGGSGGCGLLRSGGVGNPVGEREEEK